MLSQALPSLGGSRDHACHTLKSFYRNNFWTQAANWGKKGFWESGRGTLRMYTGRNSKLWGECVTHLVIACTWEAEGGRRSSRLAWAKYWDLVSETEEQEIRSCVSFTVLEPTGPYYPVQPAAFTAMPCWTPAPSTQVGAGWSPYSVARAPAPSCLSWLQPALTDLQVLGWALMQKSHFSPPQAFSLLSLCFPGWPWTLELKWSSCLASWVTRTTMHAQLL
jgi:hypothetical protein